MRPRCTSPSACGGGIPAASRAWKAAIQRAGGGVLHCPQATQHAARASNQERPHQPQRLIVARGVGERRLTAAQHHERCRQRQPHGVERGERAVEQVQCREERAVGAGTRRGRRGAADRLGRPRRAARRASHRLAAEHPSVRPARMEGGDFGRGTRQACGVARMATTRAFGARAPADAGVRLQRVVSTLAASTSVPSARPDDPNHPTVQRTAALPVRRKARRARPGHSAGRRRLAAHTSWCRRDRQRRVRSASWAAWRCSRAASLAARPICAARPAPRARRPSARDAGAASAALGRPTARQFAVQLGVGHERGVPSSAACSAALLGRRRARRDRLQRRLLHESGAAPMFEQGAFAARSA